MDEVKGVFLWNRSAHAHARSGGCEVHEARPANLSLYSHARLDDSKVYGSDGCESQLQTLRPELRIQTAIPMCQGSQIRIFASASESVWQSLKSTVQGLGSLRVPTAEDLSKSKEDFWASGWSGVWEWCKGCFPSGFGPSTGFYGVAKQSLTGIPLRIQATTFVATSTIQMLPF